MVKTEHLEECSNDILRLADVDLAVVYLPTHHTQLVTYISEL